MSSKREQKSEMAAGNSPVWIAGAMTLLILSVTAGFYWKEQARILEVRFSGHTYTTTEQLAASFEAPIGIHPDSVHFGQLMREVEQLPWVRKTGVSMEASGVMTIRVVEREPLALLMQGGSRAYVDRDGVILPVVRRRPADLPILHGFPASPAGDTLKSVEFRAVRDFLEAARSNGFGWTTISEITYNRYEGVVALSHENGVKLIFGNDEFEEKLRYWETFYAEVVRTRGIQNLSTVDFRYRNQIVTRDS